MDAGSAAAPLDAPFAGCAAVVRRDGHAVCELGDARRIEVVMPDGRRMVDVPPDADRVTLDATAAGKPVRFTLAVAKAPAVPWLDAAKKLRSKGDLARAKETVAPHASAADPIERALAQGMLARLALTEGRADDAFPLFRAAIEAHRASGRASDAADDSFALAFALHQRSHRYEEARAVLDAAKNDVAIYPEGRAREPYYRGILAGETGDHRGALAMLREASRRATELGMTKLARNARSSTALEMQELGRTVEALAILRALDAELAGASACERVESANNVGWGALLVDEAAGDGREDARSPLERAIAIEGCADAYLRSFALANLAELELADGHLDAAEKHLAAARAAVTEPRGTERLHHLDLEGHIALARGRAPKALAVFDEELALARAAVLGLPTWRALTSRAAALEALGRKKDAIAALLEAEAVLDDAALLVPLGEGRSAFVADRSASARAAVDLLVATGAPEQAARVARRSRARVLAGVERALRIAALSPDQRTKWEDAVRAFRAARAELDAAAADDWKLAADDLRKATDARRTKEKEIRAALEAAVAVLSEGGRRDEADAPPEPGDLDLVLHPGRRGWVAIAREHDGAVAYAIADPKAPPDAIAHALFEPAAARIDRARRVRVRAYGAYRGVDVHALPFRDAPLVAKVVVDYPVGLGGPRTDRRADASGRVLVVGDPTGDLPSANDEARAVTKAYAATRPPGSVTLLLRDEATSTRVSDALRGASRFHYAGHGVYAGLEGWESALPLAAGGRLGIADLLAISPLPSRVVLSGCDAARSEGDAEGLGLAQAFVAAGAEEVLAPVRPVADALAAKLASRLDADHGSLAAALRDASLAVHRDDPAADWAAFRVLAP